MIGRNETGFAAIGYEQAHRDGEDMATVAVRAEYLIGEDGTLVLSDRQDLVLADEYAAHPHSSPLLRASDLVPFKPAADVTVLGRTYAPKSLTEAGEWVCGVRIGERRQLVRASGPRRWRKVRGEWSLGEPEPVPFVDLDYRNAWSDRPVSDEVPATNPIGVMPPLAEAGDDEIAHLTVPALDHHDDSYSDPFREYRPAGFGPMPPFWRFRQRHAGTYDDAWLAERHPRLPEDFDYRFYQCAHPDLILPGYLTGDETVELARLLPGGRNLHLRLPCIELAANYRWRDGRQVRQKLNLDGLHFDLREAPNRLALTWRGWLPICPSFLCIDLATAEIGASAFVDIPNAALHGMEGEV